MHLLVTNDDGVFAPGLLALAQELRKIGDVDILAPDKNWSGGGLVKTIDRPLRIKEVFLPDSSVGYASDGAPSDWPAQGLCGVDRHAKTVDNSDSNVLSEFKNNFLF